MIRETTDAALINHFANHPDNDNPPLDFTGAIGPSTAFWMGEHGGFAFERKGDGFEGHAMVTRGGRGRWALDALEIVLTAMFQRAGRVWIRIDPAKPQNGLFARWAGFCDTGETIAGWPIFDRRR